MIGKIIRTYSESYKGLSKESWMLAIVMLINRSGSMVLPFLGVYMVDKLNFSIAQSGFVLSFFGIGAVVGSWLGGAITDKFDEYKVQAYSLFLSVPFFCALPLFTTVGSLALMIFLQSVVSEMFRPANSVAIIKYAKPENITKSFSLNRMAINLGFSIGPALGGILSAISYNFLFFSNAFAALIAGLVYVYFFRRRHLIFKRRATIRKNTVETFKGPVVKKNSPYRDFKFILFSLLCTLFSICFFQFLNSLPLFYKEDLGLSQQTIGLLLGYSGIVIVLFEMGMVNIAERKLSTAQTMLYGTILCALSYSLIGFNHHMVILVASVTLLSLGEILILPFMSTVTALRADKNNQGAYMGVNGISTSIAFIVSPVMGAKLASMFGFDALWIGSGLVLILVSIGFYFSVKGMERKF
ncbi:MFS transporter [Pseudopedobacter saltans]|nr:MFS transporter [Pseudopedobacter saltans]